MDVRARRKRLRGIIDGDRCVPLASVFDALTARMAEELGFEAGVLGGSVASLAVTGDPDLTGLTLTEFADLIKRICRAGDLSVFVDADDGYGNAFNVMRTVEEVEISGAAGLSLEDTVLPVPYGNPTAEHLIPVAEGVDKMRAALAARSDPDLVIAGRTSAASTHGIEEAIERLKAYAEAGVDAIFPIGIKSCEQLERLHAAVDLPIVFPAAAEKLSDPDYLASQGVRMVLQGHATFAVAMKAAHDTLSALYRGVKPVDLPGKPGSDFVTKYSNQARFEEFKTEFLGKQ